MHKALIIILKAWHFLLGIPGGSYAIGAILLGLMEWSRKAELTADRAGLLVTQDLEVSHRVDMKLAGGKLTDQMSIEEFKKQAEEYHAVAVWRGDLQAQAFPLLKYKISAQPPDVQLYLTWQREDGPSTIVSTPCGSAMVAPEASLRLTRKSSAPS